MIKAFKYRLYPNKETADKLQWVIDRCREIYNAALQERKEAYKYAGKTISYCQEPPLKRRGFLTCGVKSYCPSVCCQIAL